MKFSVTTQHAGQRLDVAATEHVKIASRAFIDKLIENGSITVNGESVKSGYKLKPADKVAIDYDFSNQTEAPIELPILYEDDDCLVISKPIGVLSHSKGAFNPEGTVGSFIRPKLQNLEGERAGIVHRLDRATSGVMIAAKTPEALSWLHKQFSQRKVKKTYYAVIEGEPELAKALIEVPIERNARDPKTFRPGTNGKPALTTYEVVQTGNGHSLLKLQPQTGRTHQLRVHLKYIGFPIVGDTIYGGTSADRLYLHAQQLEITLPNRQRKVFEAPLPTEFQAILEA
jgi:23S rRNA pseudouridine1911/1915/1917 synthase